MSRGPVYDADSFSDSDPRFSGPGDAKCHDGCGCSLVPLYSKGDQPFLDETRKYEELWKGAGSATKFRQAFDEMLASTTNG